MNKIKELPQEIYDSLPAEITHAAKQLLKSGKENQITEIRLRANALQTISCGEKTYTVSSSGMPENQSFFPLKLSSKELEDTVAGFCRGSLYSHAKEIENGFVSVSGIRVGICGKGMFDGSAPAGFSEILSLNIRIPCHIRNASDKLLHLIDKNGSRSLGGILVISPPGVGKTTFLRSLASALSSGYYDGGVYTRKRICIIDERGEIYIQEAFQKSLADVISFLPKDYCIELCTRVMNPEYIFCDEIGSAEQAKSSLDAASKGITFIASCHGKDIEDLKRKKHFAELFDREIFATACVLSHKGEKRDCTVKFVSGQNDGVILC